nr:hypothetical protein [Paraburkholderia terricola]
MGRRGRAGASDHQRRGRRARHRRGQRQSVAAERRRRPQPGEPLYRRPDPLRPP